MSAIRDGVLLTCVSTQKGGRICFRLLDTVSSALSFLASTRYHLLHVLVLYNIQVTKVPRNAAGLVVSGVTVFTSAGITVNEYLIRTTRHLAPNKESSVKSNVTSLFKPITFALS